MKKSYDLEDRTFCFAVEVRKLIKELTPTISNRADLHQLAKSSGSVGANYLKANNALSRKDFLMRIRICLKEAKESSYWLRLLDLDGANDDAESHRVQLIQKARNW